ncbi:uncharacterized protein [Amphiura filiformis]|uniref:uncharacterized protein n=1 Tax=Amphiura filiformis TaxID=82378 RepID=UPI003B20D60A
METNQSEAPDFMRSLSHTDYHDSKLSNETFEVLSSLHLLRYPCRKNETSSHRRSHNNKRWRHRGRRAGRRHLRRENQIPENQIPVIISNSRSNIYVGGQNGCNTNNLIPISRAKPFSNLSVYHWNARSIGNKTVTLVDYVIEKDIDIFFITETWLAVEDPVVIGNCTPPGYEFISIPRGTSNHGGIGVLFKKPLNLVVSPTGFEAITFEHQHISGPTHIHGHTLDFQAIIQDTYTDPLFYSDHNIIMCTVQYEKPQPMKVTKTSREYRKLDMQRFGECLDDRLRSIPSDCNDPDTLCDMYESITLSVLDELCPAVTKERVVKARLPWYSDNIHQERRVRRRLERRLRNTRSVIDDDALIDQKDKVNKLIVQSKQQFFTEKFLSSNTKDMFKTLNGLLNTSSRVLPNADSNTDLANDFLSFFVEKVETIRSNNTTTTESVVNHKVCENNMSGFESLSTSSVSEIICQMSNKSCSLDTLPSWLIKQNLPHLLSIITRIVNASLVSGVFPETLKHSIITPVLKKTNMDPNALKSYRPVANIKCIAKVIEKAASCQIPSTL